MVWNFILCLWSDQSKFMADWSSFIFESCSSFLIFSIAIFLLIPLDQICFQVHILTSYCFYCVQWLTIIQSKGCTRLGTSLTENTDRASFWNAILLSKIRQWTKIPKNKTVKVNFHHVLFTLLDLLTKLGPIGCPKTVIENYHSTLCNISEEHRYRMMIWRCRPWFCSTWSGSEGSSLEQFGALYMNLRQPHTFKHQI